MTIRIATAPVCWGIFEFEGAVQRYTPDQVLDQIKEAGYDALESAAATSRSWRAIAPNASAARIAAR